MLYRLLAVTAAGMYAVAALHAPEEIRPVASAAALETESASSAPVGSNAIEVSRSAFAAFGFTLAGAPAPARESAQDGPSEREAIEIALERGRAVRDERDSEQSGVVLASVGVDRSAVTSEEPGPAVETASAAPLWTVTGSTVNLRAGPGTGHPVVGQVREGDMARPLGDTSGDWIEIEVPATGASAFIFARFLEPARG